MSAYQRRKGADGEREIAALVREAFGVDAHRGAQSRSGSDAADVDGLPDWWVEVKRGKRPNVRAALAQAIAKTDGRTPVAVIRDDRKDPFVAMTWAAFVELAMRAKESK